MNNITKSLINNIIPIKKLKIKQEKDEEEKEVEVRWVKALTGRKGWLDLSGAELVLRLSSE
mgnify:CR=1 FL=1